MLTWAFEFEDQPYFDGFRTLATNGIDKPVLNVFRMAGMMRGNRVKTESSGNIPVTAIAKDGVRGAPDVDALAVRSDHDVSVLGWNYHDDDLPGPDSAVAVVVNGIPAGLKRVLARHYRIDQHHSNAWTAWKQMDSPQHPTPAQYSSLESAGQLQELESPRWIEVKNGEAHLDFTLPRHAVSLVQLSW
jgi:xylan 1,4-beta-xylosidase